MTAGNYVIIGRLQQPTAAGENTYCGFTYFLESSCCCVIIGLLPWYSQVFDQMLAHSIQQACTSFIYSRVVSGVVHCSLHTTFEGIIKQSVVNAIVSNEGTAKFT